jgi:hypothetical protein
MKILKYILLLLVLIFSFTAGINFVRGLDITSQINDAEFIGFPCRMPGTISGFQGPLDQVAFNIGEYFSYIHNGWYPRLNGQIAYDVPLTLVHEIEVYCSPIPQPVF